MEEGSFGFGDTARGILKREWQSANA